MSYLKIVNVYKKYQEGSNVFIALRNINLNFELGEFVFILGESGCGKSTLLNCILGILKVDKGKILINGQDLKKYSTRALDKMHNEQMGIIFQKYNMLKLLNLRENIEVARSLSTPYQKLVSKVKLDGKLEKKVYEVSGGECQRGAFVRCVSNYPTVLLCDEPTGALDNENSTRLIENLLEDSLKRLTIIVTHNEELANKYASRIIYMKDGAVVDDKKIREVNYKVDSKPPRKFRFFLRFPYAFRLFLKKKGRFFISFISTFFILFFITLGLIFNDVSSDVIRYNFLNGCDSNVFDLESTNPDGINIHIVESLKKDERFTIRYNFKKFLNDYLINDLKFSLNGQKIDLRLASFKCSSMFNKGNLIKGEGVSNYNELIINKNLDDYFLKQGVNILDKRISIDNEIFKDCYFKVKGVATQSLMNEEMAFYLDYNYLYEYLKDVNLDSSYYYDYQIDVKNVNDIKKCLKDLEENVYYGEGEDCFSYSHNVDYENYLMFETLINMALVVLYIFIFLALLISLFLLTNMIYSINLEEMKELAILKVLGVSYFNIGSLLLIISFIIGFVSYVILLISIHYLNIYLSPFLHKFLNYHQDFFLLNINQKVLIFLMMLLIEFTSILYPYLKLCKLPLTNALREDV